MITNSSKLFLLIAFSLPLSGCATVTDYVKALRADSSKTFAEKVSLTLNNDVCNKFSGDRTAVSSWYNEHSQTAMQNLNTAKIKIEEVTKNAREVEFSEAQKRSFNARYKEVVALFGVIKSDLEVPLKNVKPPLVCEMRDDDTPKYCYEVKMEILQADYQGLQGVIPGNEEAFLKELIFIYGIGKKIFAAGNSTCKKNLKYIMQDTRDNLEALELASDPWKTPDSTVPG